MNLPPKPYVSTPLEVHCVRCGRTLCPRTERALTAFELERFRREHAGHEIKGRHPWRPKGVDMWFDLTDPDPAKQKATTPPQIVTPANPRT